jgi:hypothetical protein
MDILVSHLGAIGAAWVEIHVTGGENDNLTLFFTLRRTTIIYLFFCIRASSLLMGHHASQLA